MNTKISYMTQESHAIKKRELDELKTTGRMEAAKAIGEAREKGDLSENAEYDAAKDAQGLLELKISQLEAVMATTRIIKEEDLDISTVVVLSTVKIKQLKSGKIFTYTLVSQSEANLRQKKISVDSPIGQGLLGKAIGESAQIKTPNGSVSFEVLDISINL